jgi:UDP-4-amino-4,6-dideoxy-N-acetyl-beta-L-altrosamine N-acetyltransferase
MISFRPLRREDKEMVRQWRNLPHIRRYMLTDHVIGPDEHAAWFDRVFDNPRYRHWIIRCEKEDVGLLDLYNIDADTRTCYWGFYLAGSNLRGKNVGMFAEFFVLQYVFEQLQFSQLCCETMDFNRGVLRLHEAFGFIQQAGSRRQIVRGDGVHEVICLRILKSEWEQKRPQFERIFRTKGWI